MAFFETFFFAINLYSTNLKLINQDDYVQNEMINEAMDGSIRKDKKINHKFTTIIRKKTMNAPIKNQRWSFSSSNTNFKSLISAHLYKPYKNVHSK